MVLELQKLCDMPGLSGDEQQVADYIMDQIEPHCESVYLDRLGNVIAVKKGAKKPASPLMFCAHMDEVGMILTAQRSDMTFSFGTVGGIDGAVLPGKQVRLCKNNAVGLIATAPIHLTKKEQRSKPYEIEDLFIDFPKQADARPGDRVMFDGVCFDMGDYFCGKAIDDRFGCLVLMEMIREQIPYDCTFVFTVQEEIGCRGAAAAAFQVQPGIAVVIETTTAADIPEVSGGKRVCLLGDGPVISHMDRGTIYDRALYEKCRQVADELGIPNQTKTLIAGGNDAQRIQLIGAGARMVAISLPCRYLHSPSCVVHKEDMKHMMNLCKAIVDPLGKEL